MVLTELPKTREEAKNIGSKSYFTNEPCKNGHLDKRYTNTGICYSCKRKNMNNDYLRHFDRIKNVNHKSYSKNRKKRLVNSQTWAENNREKSNAIKKKYKLNNPEKIKNQNKKYSLKMSKDPKWKLNKNMSKAIWSWLKGSKAFKHWEEFVEFTFEELKIHLEKQFRGGMTWENYGYFWHIDHIKPKSLCSTFQEAWKLSNLQPLTVKENLSKNNKYIGNPNNRIMVDF